MRYCNLIASDDWQDLNTFSAATCDLSSVSVYCRKGGTLRSYDIGWVARWSAMAFHILVLCNDLISISASSTDNFSPCVHQYSVLVKALSICLSLLVRSSTLLWLRLLREA